jgi:hypothetical protein
VNLEKNAPKPSLSLHGLPYVLLTVGSKTIDTHRQKDRPIISQPNDAG